MQASDAALPLGLTLTINGDQVRGKGPCNTFGATWPQDEGCLSIQKHSYGMCPLLQEERYFRLLNGTTSVDVEQNQMTLSGPAGSVTFARGDWGAARSRQRQDAA
jgi:heat shock protein HslJ